MRGLWAGLREMPGGDGFFQRGTGDKELTRGIRGITSGSGEVLHPIVGNRSGKQAALG